MSEVQYDCDAWTRYPQHRWIFNKLDLSLLLGYCAGPGGTSVPQDDDYVVRPIMNLSGMGAGAKQQFIACNDFKTVEPGYFWCEYFQGKHTTVDYEWQMIDDLHVLRPIFAAEGYRTNKELYRFSAWRRVTPPLWPLPKWINSLRDVPKFNIEFIDDKIIEIHLRSGIDFPDKATQIIPRWSDMSDSDCAVFDRLGFNYKTDFDDADGHLNTKRLGFYYK